MLLHAVHLFQQFLSFSILLKSCQDDIHKCFKIDCISYMQSYYSEYLKLTEMLKNITNLEGAKMARLVLEIPRLEVFWW